MESNDESIKLLKKRMHQQMSVSSENDIKPENIQYYVSSLMMQKEDVRQKEEQQREEDEQGARQNLRSEEDKEEAADKESEEYKDLPMDIESIKKPGEIPPLMKDIKVPEAMEGQHERAKTEYEKVLQAVDDEEIFGFRKPHWLNIKG